MAQQKFRLSDYCSEMQKIASENKCTLEVAMQLMIANLATMKEHYKGASNLNYHELGQSWNSLKGDERNAQKEEARVRLARYKRGGSAE